MKAVVAERYGPPAEVLEIRDVDVPAIGEDDMLVRTHATSANPADWHLIRGEPQIARLQIGLRRPKHRCWAATWPGPSRRWAPT
jgi:NADPH:quinone reductase-like Zn-dependent oxidoreductase